MIKQSSYKFDDTDLGAFLAVKADKTNVLGLDNVTEYAPGSSYEPATKAYVDAMATTGGGNVEITKVARFIATEGQTEFEVVYLLGSLTVSLNGFILDSTDYTAGDGLKIVLEVGAKENDIVRVISYGGADVYNKTQTNTLLESKTDENRAIQLAIALG